MATECDMKRCVEPASKRVKFGPPRPESLTLCDDHADEQIEFDRSVEEWADPEVVKSYD